MVGLTDTIVARLVATGILGFQTADHLLALKGVSCGGIKLRTRITHDLSQRGLPFHLADYPCERRDWPCPPDDPERHVLAIHSDRQDTE